MEVEKEGYAEGAVFLLSLEGVQDWTQVNPRNISSLYTYVAQYIFKKRKSVLLNSYYLGDPNSSCR
jgi:hypothetical protein